MSISSIIRELTGTATVSTDLDDIVMSEIDDAVRISGSTPVIVETLMDFESGDQPASATMQSTLLQLRPGRDVWIRYADFFPARAPRSRLRIRWARPTPQPPTQSPNDVPCDFAVADRTDAPSFFPSPCEPCGSGPVRVPPSCGPSLAVPMAAGGCVRPRFFNGMFITREDLETQLRYFRLKQRMQNRAMGQGVVWGLPVSLRAGKIIVGSGYAVDCCGNDLAVSCEYAVDTALLRADPAICSRLTTLKCAKLALEYVECLEEPRPVHADVCSSAAAGCEMSRVRETVRLRLMLPCDHDDKSRLERAVETLLNFIPKPPPTDTPEARWTPVFGVPIHWALAITNKPRTVGIQPDSTLGPDGSVPQPREVTFEFDLQNPTLDFAVRTTSGSFDTSVSTMTVSGQPAPVVNIAGVRYTIPINQDLAEVEMIFRWTQVVGADSFRGTTRFIARANAVENGRGFTENTDGSVIIASGIAPAPNVGDEFVASQGGATTQRVRVTNDLGDGRFALRTVDGSPADPSVFSPQKPFVIVGEHAVTITVPPTAVEQFRVADVLRPAPCCAGDCCAERPTFTRAQLLRLLALALAYGRLVQTYAAGAHIVSRPAVSGLTSRPVLLDSAISTLHREALVQLRLRIASLLEIRLADRRDALEDALAELFHAWCANAIYPGPSCDCSCGGSCGHHGVVIGCVRFKGGEICAVDPLEGRRWVVHPPLLEHWGRAFGMTPVDESMMRLFDKLCCISRLPGFGDLFERSAPPRGDGVARADTFSERSALSLAGLRPAPALPATPWIDKDELDELTGLIATIEHASPGSLIERVNEMLCRPVAVQPRPPARRQPSFELDSIDRVMTRIASGATIEPLSETFARDAAVAVVTTTSLESASPSPRLAESLKKRGVETVADLLASRSIVLYRDLAAEGLAADYDAAVDRAAKSAKAASEASKTAASSIKPEELASDDALDRFAKRLADRLPGVDPRKITEHLRRGVERN